MRIELVEIENSRLPFFCKKNRVAHHFFGYLGNVAPQARSWGVVNSENEIVGLLANGRSTKNFEFFYDWLVADNNAVAELLLTRYLKNCETDAFPRGLWFDLIYRDCVESNLGSLWKTTFDQELILTPQQIRSQKLTSGLEILLLTKENFDTFKVHELVSPSLGNGSAIKEAGMEFMAAIRNGVVVSIAEATVRFCDVASIQQVLCIPELRGQGVASSVVEKLCRHLFTQNINIATYIAAEANVASLRLAQKVGFELYSRLGFAELK